MLSEPWLEDIDLYLEIGLLTKSTVNDKMYGVIFVHDILEVFCK